MVILNKPSGQEEQVILENEIYKSLLLPGFELPLAPLLIAADRLAQAK
jgi:hypothetical protein